MGNIAAHTWSLVEFQTNEFKFDERLYIIPFPNHPVFQALSEYWGGFEWAAAC
jgi:hypothetical protein